MPNFIFEQKYNFSAIGIDEAGCGPWAGPVVASAVFFKNNHNICSQLLKLIDDSKKLSAKKRQKAYEALLAEQDINLSFAYGIASVEEIDKINIRQATMLAMQRAAQTLNIPAKIALIDGKIQPQLDCPILNIIRGDSLSFSIAAASIVAKITRDQIMLNYSVQYPQYNWQKNAGYGTKQHIEALKKFGVTPHHRRSFAPIRKLLSS